MGCAQLCGEGHATMNKGDLFIVSKEDMDKMQDRSHRYCFVANSLSEDVKIEINI